MNNKINSKIKSTSPALAGTPQRGELKRGESWTIDSLYPYWEISKNKLLIGRAKELRKAGNLSEVLFWKIFKNKKQLGFDIDRQVIIANYIADFFIPELGLVFEIDGLSHNDKLDYDIERDTYMQSLDLQVVRISDIDVKKKIGDVYNYVLQIVNERKKHLSSPR